MEKDLIQVAATSKSTRKRKKIEKYQSELEPEDDDLAVHLSVDEDSS